MLIYYIYALHYAFGKGGIATVYLCGGQRTTCGSWFSPSSCVDSRAGTQIIRLSSKSLY